MSTEIRPNTNRPNRGVPVQQILRVAEKVREETRSRYYLGTIPIIRQQIIILFAPYPPTLSA